MPSPWRATFPLPWALLGFRRAPGRPSHLFKSASPARRPFRTAPFARLCSTLPVLLGLALTGPTMSGCTTPLERLREFPGGPAAAHDPALLAEATNIKMDMTYTSPESLEQLVAKLYQTPPALIATVKAILPNEK